MQPLFQNYDYLKTCQSSTFPRYELLKQVEKPKSAIEVAKKIKSKFSEEFEKANFLCCRECKYPITQETSRININEQHQHVFANPHGHVYQIGCFSQAPGCIAYGEATDFFTWFPGYSWQIVICRQCADLLGWFFQSKEAMFWGLILDKLINFEQKTDY